MNLLDIILGVILSFCLIKGLAKGFVRELFSMVGVLAGFYCAYTWFGALGLKLSLWTTPAPYWEVVAFILIFLGAFFAVILMGSLLNIILKFLIFRWISAIMGATLGVILDVADRILGALTGAFKGFLIVFVILTALNVFLPADSTFVKGSFLAPRIFRFSEMILSIVPEDFRAGLDVITNR